MRRCIDSLLAQTFRDFELLLIDDGSTDGSPAICDEYMWSCGSEVLSSGSEVRNEELKLKTQNSKHRAPIIHVIHKKNGGVSSARNVGLDIARGEWVTFIDSDDSIGENFFHDVAGAEEDLLVRGYFMHDLHGREVERLVLDDLSPQPELSWFVNRYIGFNLLRGPVAKFYRRSIIGDLRFPEDMKVGEDTWFVWSYLSRISAYKILYYYYYYVSTGGPSEVKYRSTTAYAIRSLQHLCDAFGPMSEKYGISRSQFLQFIGYFKCISKGDWEKQLSLWYHNQEVRRLYKYVWPDLGIRQKLRLLVARILRR